MLLSLKKISLFSLGILGASFVTASLASPTAPQPILPKEGLTITSPAGKAQHFQVEMALNPEEQEAGEMFRTSVPEDGGMLFVWKTPQVSHMWMRNTLVPLDMIFVSPSGRIVDIKENTVPHSERDISSSEPVKWTLELAGGVAEKDRIFIGDTVTLDKETKAAEEAAKSDEKAKEK
ncbi:DUF192 domain-containing protein [Acetobacteraceae bacterium]|nr:DUF192 domain-containing protein [Acetobacteraceae bacterium]